jgi:hypothetical protein
MNLTSNEITAIAKFIDPIFTQYASTYSFEKYPPEDYERYKSVFSRKTGENDEIHAALVWKWGHIGKNNFPSKQKELIDKVNTLWPEYVQSGCENAKSSFEWWRLQLPGTAYITAAYLTHLVHHFEPVPIIDQHNFRAMNGLIKAIRSTHEATKVPKNWQDIANLRDFMSALLLHLRGRSSGELDRFLMMYGRSIKVRKSKNSTGNLS